MAQLIGCAFLWHGQQADPIPRSDISLVVLAPTASKALRDELRLLDADASDHQPGVLRLDNLPFTAWLVETDAMAERGEPVLSLVSRVFLRERERIIEALERTGHVALLSYVLQQVQQSRSLGKEFAMQHKDWENLEETEKGLVTAVLESISAEDRLRGLPPEEVLRHYTAEELAAGLSDEQAARLRELLERRQSP